MQNLLQIYTQHKENLFYIQIGSNFYTISHHHRFHIAQIYTTGKRFDNIVNKRYF